MLWTRWLIYGVPVALGLLTWWSAHQAALSRHAKRDEIVVASGEGLRPTLHPFLPVSEADRQVVALVHEPLLKLDANGDLRGALAKEWSWTQQTSFWFASVQYATQAAAKLKKLTPEQWAKWQLTRADQEGTSLQLQFNSPGTGAPLAILQMIAEYGPLPVETLRVELKEEARSHHEFFLQNAVEAAQVKSVAFTGPMSYELNISGETVKFYEELELYYRNHPTLEAKIKTLTRAPFLNRPQLEFVLREAGFFHDGTTVTSVDVAATVRLVLSQPWPVTGRQGLELISGWDTSAADRVRIIFRELYSPALNAFVGLPILPERWIKQHGAALAENPQLFLQQPPPGAGLCLLENANDRMLFLSRRDDPTGRRLQFLLDQPPSAIRMGFAMKAVDAFWPGAGSVAGLSSELGVQLHASMPRSRLMVMWNCRQAPLDDVRVREALGMAVDRTALLEESLQGQGEIHEGIFQPGIWFSQRLPIQPHDPTKARQILYEAGWAKDASGLLTKAGKPLTVDLLTPADNPMRLGLAEQLEDYWAALGVKVSVIKVSREEMLDQRLPARNFSAALLGLDFETTWDQWPYWHSSQMRRGLNFSGLALPRLDTVLQSLRVEFDPARVPALAQEAENLIIAQHPYLPLFAGGSPLALRRDLAHASRKTDRSVSFSLRDMIMQPVDKTPER
jgi:ABC-type transport system substrate-binding protein